MDSPVRSILISQVPSVDMENLLAHRQLAYAIGYDGQGSEVVDDGLRNKNRLEKVCSNLNFRHRNAQMAGRASIEYYVGQALKARARRRRIARLRWKAM